MIKHGHVQKLSSHSMVYMTSWQFTPVTIFSEGGAFYVNNQSRWGCPYLSKNASCTILRIIRSQWHGKSLSGSSSFSSLKVAGSFHSLMLPLYTLPPPLLFPLLNRQGPIMSKLSALQFVQKNVVNELLNLLFFTLDMKNSC